MGVIHVISCVVMLFVWAVTSQLLQHSYSRDCNMDRDGVTSIVLGNHGQLNITFVFLCAGGSIRVPVRARSSEVFPALLRPETDSPRDICRFKDFSDGVTKRLQLFVEQTFEIFVFGQIYCDMSQELPVPIEPYHSSCMTNSEGELTVTYMNPFTVSARTTVSCWNGESDLGNTPSWMQRSFKSVFYDGGNRAYNACVLNPWLEDTQFLDFRMERVGKSPLDFRIYCQGSPPETDAPVVRVHSYCMPDPNVLKIHLDNFDDEDVEFTLKCKREDHVIKVKAGGRTFMDAVFSQDGVTNYPNNTCVLMTAPAKFGDRQYAVVLTAKDNGKHTTNLQVCHKETFPPYQAPYIYRTTCEADGFGNFPIELYNYGQTTVTFVLDCFNGKVKVVLKSETGRTVSGAYFDEEAVVSSDICIFRPVSDSTEGVRLLVQESATFFLGDNIYCNKRSSRQKTRLPYETDCHPDNNNVLSILLRSEETATLFKMSCFHGPLEFTVNANSTASITAALYAGEFEDYPGSCVFKPWVGRMQYIQLSAKRPGQSWRRYKIICRTEPEFDKPVVQVETDCAPNNQGVVRVSLHNNDDETVKFRYSCYNGVLTKVLPPKTSANVEVAMYQGKNYSYDPEACIFLENGFQHLMNMESQTLFVVAEKPTGKYSPWLISCPASPAPFHVPAQYKTNCIPNAEGVVSVSLVNYGNHSIKYFLTCANGVFRHDVGAESVKVVSAVFSEVDPADTGICQFTVANRVTEMVVVKVHDKERFFFGNLMCDRRNNTPEPFVPYNTTCVPKNGVIDIHVSNDADTPLNVKLVCRNGDVPLRLQPRSSQTVPAEFYSLSTRQPGACMFMPFPDSVDQSVFMTTIRDGEGTSLDHFIECRNRDRVGASEPNVEYGCVNNKDGTFTVTARSRESALVKLLTVCRGSEKPRALAAGGSLSISAAFFQGEGFTHPKVDCILLSLPPYFAERKQALSIQAVLQEDFSATYVFCHQDTKPTPVIPDGPIVRLVPRCPESIDRNPSLELRADVPSYAMARCRNGDKQFTAVDRASFTLRGRFDQEYRGQDCLFYKKSGSNTFTVEVEMGWGDGNSVILQYQRITTVSCSYDDHGSAISPQQRVRTAFLAPVEIQTLRGGNSSANFSLIVTDVLNNAIDTDHIPIGRKIRLKAWDTSGFNSSFRALSCEVFNGVTTYSILHAGCGDGLVLPKTAGFQTVGPEVHSPYFNAFKMAGSSTVQFSCRFVVCPTKYCDGNSCRNERRGKRSATKHDHHLGVPIISRPYRLL